MIVGYDSALGRVSPSDADKDTDTFIPLFC